MYLLLEESEYDKSKLKNAYLFIAWKFKGNMHSVPTDSAGYPTGLDIWPNMH